MTSTADLQTLSDDDYVWLTRHLKLTRPVDPQGRERFDDLWRRLGALTLGPDGQVRTSYHEAAHAIVARALGFNVVHVLIRDDESGEVPWVQTENLNSTAWERLAKLRDFATVKSAGYVAEQVQWRYARIPEKDLVGEVVQHVWELQSLAASLPEEERKRFYSHFQGQSLFDRGLVFVELCETRAESILRTNWGVVQRLAAEVLENRRVTGASLEAILSEVEVGGSEKRPICRTARGLRATGKRWRANLAVLPHWRYSLAECCER